MNKTKELVGLLQEYPDHELIFLYPEEGSDYPFTLGHPSRILVDEYVTINERVWLKNDEYDSLFDEIADNVFDDLYPHKQYANEEDEKEIDRITKKRIDELNWRKAIVVYIYP